MARPKPVKAADLKLNTCKRMLRRGSKRVECGRQYLGEERNCPNNGSHITVKTGFCGIGSHEGEVPTSASGKPMPTCSWIETCACDCHDKMGKLFELTGATRIVVDSSGYVPDIDRTALAYVSDVHSSILDATDASQGHEDASGTPHRPVYAGPSTATPTGKTPKGQLEEWVRQQCEIYLVEQYDFPCTPKWISNEIGRTQAIAPPSQGAIASVFNRWEVLGYAEFQSKPMRFVRLTPSGDVKGLAAMKEEAKTRERLARAQIRRGSLR